MADVDICNMALSHLGHSVEIVTLATDRTKAAAACRAFFTQTLQEVLRDFPWPFAARFATLTLVEEDPNVEWLYSYRYPTDALRIKRVTNQQIRLDSQSSRVPYKLGSDVTGRLIYCDMEDAVVEYTHYVTDTALFPPDFLELLSLLLAAYIAPRITGGDPEKLGARALAMYEWRRRTGQMNAANEEQDDPPIDADGILARER